MRARRVWFTTVGIIALALLLAGCIPQPPQVVKIGLVAPFEGRFREIGYDIIPAARLAIREYTAQSEETGVIIELVAYDDGGDPAKAAEQAAKLAADPDVRLVLGHWLDATTQAALPVYENAGLPCITFMTAAGERAATSYNFAPDEDRLAEAISAWAEAQDMEPTLRFAESLEDAIGLLNEPDIIGGPDWGTGQFYELAGDAAEGAFYATGMAFPADSAEAFVNETWLAAFDAAYKSGSLGAAPGPLALNAYQATWLAIREVVEAAGGQPPTLPIELPTFDSAGQRIDAPVYIYRWEDGARQLAAFFED